MVHEWKLLKTAYISKSTHPIDVKINTFGVLTETNISQKEKFKSVRFCKSYRERKKISHTGTYENKMEIFPSKYEIIFADD
jgi:hypothetical protein